MILSCARNPQHSLHSRHRGSTCCGTATRKVHAKAWGESDVERNALGRADATRRLFNRSWPARKIDPKVRGRRRPLMKNVELALNVASCDNPSVIATMADDETRLHRFT